MKITDLFESAMPRLPSLKMSTPVLFRAMTNRTRYPSGTFWSMNSSVADHYSRKTTKSHYRPIQVYVPNSLNCLNIDALARVSPQMKSLFFDHFERWCLSKNVDPSTTYFHDVLVDGETDFIYPTQADVDYLSMMGFDAVFFSMEGGTKVNTVFLFGQGTPAATELLSNVIDNDRHFWHNLVISKI